jgi:hypothetical protein
MRLALVAVFFVSCAVVRPVTVPTPAAGAALTLQVMNSATTGPARDGGSKGAGLTIRYTLDGSTPTAFCTPSTKRRCPTAASPIIYITWCHWPSA